MDTSAEGSASKHTIVCQPAAQTHRLEDKQRPVRIPDLCRKSMILFFSPYSHPRVISTFSRAGNVVCRQHKYRHPELLCANHQGLEAGAARGPTRLCQIQASGATPGMLLSPLPTGFYAQTPHCPQALRLQAGLGHARGCAPDKSPSANSCSRETGRNQLYRCYQGLSIICSVPALLYLMKQSWLCC